MSLQLPYLSVVALLFLAAAAQADIATVAKAKQWRALLGDDDADSKSYFLTSPGARDPEGELRAHLAGFRREKDGLHLQCRFPARYAYLKRELPAEFPREHQDASCPNVDAFLRQLGGSALSLVFSSAYPGSPPSMFGHTLLRVHAHGRPALSDYAVNYAAAVGPDENSLAFTVLGLAGGYWGTFALVPYFMKVNEYAHAESRDLWEYELGLTESEVHFALLHLWELSREPTFRYYFFDENCSHRILRLISVAKPEWPLKTFPLHVIPAETIKALTAIPGAVREVRERPSLRTQLKNQLRRSGLSSPELFPDERDPASLELAIAYFKFETFHEHHELSPEKQARYEALLLARSRLGVIRGDLPAASAASRPEHGHGPFLVGASAGAAGGRAFAELRGKVAYHDLLNSDVGFPAFTQVDFPNFALRSESGGSGIYLERLGLFTATSLAPWNSWERRFSWRVDLSVNAGHELACAGCKLLGFEGGIGLTRGLIGEHTLGSLLLLARGEVGSGLVGSGRLTPRVQANILSNPQARYKFQLQGTLIADVGQSLRPKLLYMVEWNHSFQLSQAWDVRALSKLIQGRSGRQWNGVHREVGLGIKLLLSVLCIDAHRCRATLVV